MKDNKYLKVTNFDGKNTYIKVNIEIYNDYQRSIWREEYHNKKSDKEPHCEDMNEKFIPRELHSPSSEEIYCKKLQYEKLHKAIEQLPKVQRRRIILRYFHDLTILQIAEIENVKKSAISMSISNSIEKIKKFLKLP